MKGSTTFHPDTIKSCVLGKVAFKKKIRRESLANAAGSGQLHSTSQPSLAKGGSLFISEYYFIVLILVALMYCYAFYVNTACSDVILRFNWKNAKMHYDSWLAKLSMLHCS